MEQRLEDWLKVPERRRGIPAWRLCLLMGLTALILLAGAPVLFALDAGNTAFAMI